MKIGIIGAGAIGMLLASYLEGKHSVTIYTHRLDKQHVIKENGIQLYQQGKWQQTKKVAVQPITADFTSLDCCIVCVKQSHIHSLYPNFKQLPDTMPLIFIQNGMGHLPVLRQMRNNVFIGIVEHGAKRLSDVEVSQNGEGRIMLASLTGNDQEAQELVTTLHQTVFPFEIAYDWLEIMKQKMVVNSVINPLTALFQVKNEAIITNASIQKLAKQLCVEAASTLELNEELAWSRVSDVAIKTGENTSSMLQDIMQGRKTEIQAISGYLLHVSSIILPYTSFVYDAIRALERRDKTT